jgi:hypothetical protein
LVRISARRFDVLLIPNINTARNDIPGVPDDIPGTPYTVVIGKYKAGNADGQAAGSIYLQVNDPVNQNNNISMNEAYMTQNYLAQLNALKGVLPVYWTYPLPSAQKTSIIQKVNAFPLISPPLDLDFAWDFADDPIPNVSSFQVTANGQSIAVQQVAFKRQPLYSSHSDITDVRIQNALYIALAPSPAIADGALVQVNNPDASLWPTYMQFVAHKEPVRYGPAIHVNQEGFLVHVKQGPGGPSSPLHNRRLSAITAAASLRPPRSLTPRSLWAAPTHRSPGRVTATGR